MNLCIKKTAELDNRFGCYPSYYRSIEDLLTTIEKTATFNEWIDYYKMDCFYGTGNEIWNYKKSEVSPELWRAIYKFSAAYECDWQSSPKNANLFRSGNILDFGAGNGFPWAVETISNSVNLYMIELNESIRKKLQDNYAAKPNVFVLAGLSEVKNRKFDFIYSEDTLEHVRFINEHLWVLYKLGNSLCEYYLKIDEAACQAHVLNLYDDTRITPPFSEMIA